MNGGYNLASNTEMKIFTSAQALSAGVAGWLLALAQAKAGPFAICLSGGTTPRALYEQLAGAPLRELFPWERTHLFWGDERFVPHDDAASNYRMVQEALLGNVPLPRAQIHPIPTTGATPDEAAAAYEQTLRTFYGQAALDPARPLFDVTFLGLGADGHTASLFPGTKVLEERARWVAPVIGAKPEPRLTLTYPALESSRHVAFLVQGRDKREMLQKLRGGDLALPAARLTPVGQRYIFADAAAAEDS